MRLAILSLVLASAAWAVVPTVSGVSVDSVYHNSARISWSWSVCTPIAGVINYGVTSGYGAVQGIVGLATPNATGLTGLAASTTYHFSPSFTCDGSTFSTPVDTTFTTAALPAVHPEYPIPPPAYTPTFPNTSGYNAVTVTGASDCGLQTIMNTAVANQSSNGTVITIPAGQVCSGNYIWPLDTNSAIKTWLKSGVSGSNITVTAHGYSPGQQVIIESQYGCGNGCGPGGFLPTPLIRGEIYCIGTTTTNTFTLEDASCTNAITLTDTGTSTTNYVTVWPPYNRNSIVIQTGTADANFVPPGVRVAGTFSGLGNALKSLMGSIIVPGGNAGTGNAMAFQTHEFTHDIWYRGLEISQTDTTSTLATTSNDPAPTLGFIAQLASNAYITFDRCYIHGLPLPNRIKWWLQWGGHYVSIINTEASNLLYPQASQNPPYDAASPAFVCSLTSNVVTCTPGSTNLFNGLTCSTVSPITFTYTSGTATNGGFIEVGLDCTPHLYIPNATTATCTGGLSNGSTTLPCSVTNMATPAYTLFATTYCNQYQNFRLASFATGSGWSSLVGSEGQYNTGFSCFNSEGTQAVYTGQGRGPFYLINNFISGAGNILHMDDQRAVSQLPAPTGYYWYRNTFDMPNFTIAGQAGWNGFWYGHRETTEWKQGTQIALIGNIFNGSQTDVSPYGCFTLFSSRGALVLSDVRVGYNTFIGGPCAFDTQIRNDNGLYGPPIQRFWVHDNLCMNMNGFGKANLATHPAGTATGTMFTLENGPGDLRFENNTCPDTGGSSPGLQHIAGWFIEGMKITDNIFAVHGDNTQLGLNQESMNYNTPSCGGLTAKALTHCAFTAGVSTSSYQFQNNVLIPGFATSNSASPSGDITVAAVTSAWPTDGSFATGQVIQAGANPTARMQSVGFVKFAYGGTPQTGNDLRLLYTSPYDGGGASPGTNGTNRGANMEALKRAQGLTTHHRTIAIGSTGFTAAFWMQDPGNACTVFYGPTGNSLASILSTGGRVTDTTNALPRAIAVTGLSAHTTYDWYEGCAGSMMYGPFTVTTQ